MTGQRLGTVVITNDDGIDAPGIAVLEQAARGLADRVVVVAPDRDHSGASAVVSLHQPLRVKTLGADRHAVSGSPADCVILALEHLCGGRPDLVLSGINAGANLADELTYSGTVAAAMTAHQLGIPGLAFSQAYHGPRRAVSFGPSAAVLAGLLPRLVPFAQQAVLNVNIPATIDGAEAPVEITRQGTERRLKVTVEQREDLREGAYYWMSFARMPVAQAEDSDIAALKRGAVSVTPIGIDRTRLDLLQGLAAAFVP